MTASTERPMGAIPMRPNAGNWRTQADALLTPIERELETRLLKARQAVEELERELADLRATKRVAGVATEV